MLILQNTFNVPLHPVSGSLPHSLGSMSVNIKRKTCRFMAQIHLDGLDVIPAHNGSNGITVPEVKKAGVLITQSANDLFKFFIDRYMDQVTSEAICKHKPAGIAPCFTSCQSFLFLFFLTTLKQMNNIRCNSNKTRSAVFGRDKRVISSDFLRLLKQCICVRPFALPFYSLGFEMERTRLAAVPLPYLSDTNITHILNAMKREKK